MQKFIIMCGVPASGKTTMAKQLEELYDAIYVSSDEIRATNGLKYSPIELRTTFYILHKMVSDAMTNKQNVIIDATNLTVATRKGLFENKLFNFDGYEKICYVANTPFEECVKRNATRPEGIRVPDEKLEKFNSQFEYPTLDEGFDEIHAI